VGHPVNKHFPFFFSKTANWQIKNIDLLFKIFLTIYILYNSYCKFLSLALQPANTESPGTKIDKLREVVGLPTAGSNELEIESGIQD